MLEVRVPALAHGPLALDVNVPQNEFPLGSAVGNGPVGPVAPAPPGDLAGEISGSVESEIRRSHTQTLLLQKAHLDKVSATV